VTSFRCHSKCPLAVMCSQTFADVEFFGRNKVVYRCDGTSIPVI
jgi:hypothetical protein